MISQLKNYHDKTDRKSQSNQNYYVSVTKPYSSLFLEEYEVFGMDAININKEE
jgi:hypothetical protein